MELLFLGTGGVSGVPQWNCDCDVCKSPDPKDKRLRSALFVRIGEVNIAIDFGPDFRTQLLSNGIRKLDEALLTHAHGDHINGYHELARQEGIRILAPRAVLDEFAVRTGGLKWFRAKNPTASVETFAPFRVGNVEIDSVAVEHQKDYAKESTPCCGYLFRTPTFAVAYITDYSKILEAEKLRGIDLLIADGCGMEPNQGHAGVLGSIETFKRCGAKRLLLTHLSHETATHRTLEELVKSKGNIGVAYDGLRVETD